MFQKIFNSGIAFQAYFILVLLAISSPAHAYLDPGSGSVILQGILAAIAAIAVVAKIYWHRLLQLLGLRKKTVINDSAADALKNKDN